jgi:dsDNA-specific endonuclease/ATPase MutS2
MGQDEGTGRAQVSEARDPEEIREDIEATREDLGETVEALAAKADVKAQARQKASRAKESLTAKKDELVSKAKQTSPDGAPSSAQQLSRKARENPLPVAALGAFAAGFLVGRRGGR